jgi:ATP-dependent Clp protease ATP-binding subunit ClpC
LAHLVFVASIEAAMFERYSEKARRVILFARFEGSQYGSPHIESAHLLVGLQREEKGLVRTALPDPEAPGKQIRAEIEARIERHEPIPISVVMPLSGEGSRVLNLATEEADRLSPTRKSRPTTCSSVLCLKRIP